MSKNAEFAKDEQGRRPHQTADDRLPVKNMTDWGCTGGRIKEPRYAERAFELCSQAGNEAYLKIKGQVHDIRTPGMLAKQRLYKDAFQSQNRIQSTPGQDSAPLKIQVEKSRPFFVGRKKQR